MIAVQREQQGYHVSQLTSGAKIVASVIAHPLPEGALLARYKGAGHYTDCFRTHIHGHVTLAEYVAGFYTTAVFKVERAILKVMFSKGSTDVDAQRLAEGAAETFAAWEVEARAPHQILLADFKGQTRSWLMVEHVHDSTVLYFGSAFVGQHDTETGGRKAGVGHRALVGFHKLYSVTLLAAARSRLARQIDLPPR